jgi:flagellar motor switch protein FliG
MDPSRIAHILQAELPQTTAAVLLGMSPKQAGQLLAQLPDAYRMIVLPRLADSQLPRPWALECVADALLATLASQAVTASPDPAGRLGLHAILGQSDPDVRQILWSSIERVRPDLAERLKV